MIPADDRPCGVREVRVVDLIGNRLGFGEPLDTFRIVARVVELVDTRDLKGVGWFSVAVLRFLSCPFHAV